MYLFSLSDSKNSSSFITPWTFLHFINGFMFSIFTLKYTQLTARNSFILYFIIHFIYECKDYYYSYVIFNKIDKKYKNDRDNTLMNSIGDHLFAIIGWVVGYYFFYYNKTNTNYLKIVISFFIIYFGLSCLFTITSAG